jgi:hypothetical protein
VIAGALALMVGHAVSAKTGSVTQMIETNALLSIIFKQDPQKAVRLASEVERSLAVARQGGPEVGGPQLRFRGGVGSRDQAATQDSEIISRNRKDFDENPVLREIYSRSPLASLRMLKRLRDAAGKN